MTPQTQSRFKGGIFVMGAQAVVLVLGYVTHFLIGKILGPAPYGIYGVVLSVQTIFGLFLTLGVPVAIARFVAQDQHHAQGILRQGGRLQIGIGLIVSLIVAILSPVIARLLGDESLVPYIVMIAVVIFSQSAYPIYVQFFSGMHLFTRQSLLTSIYAVVKLVGALSLIFVLGVYGAFAGFLIGGIVAGIVGWWWTRSLGGQAVSPLPYRAFLSFAGVYVIVLVGLQLLISIDLFMVKALLEDDVQAGYYNASVTLSRISYMLLQSLGFVLLPSVAKLTAPGMTAKEGAAFIGRVLRYLIGLIIPSVLIAATTSKALVLLFFTEEFIPAAPSLSILMVGVGSLAFYLLLTNIAAGAGQPYVPLAITGVLLLISGALGFILIPQFGLIGAAWQTTVAGIVGLAALGVYTFRKFAIPFPWRSTINIMIASIVAVAPTYLWQAGPVTVFVQYGLAGVIYVAVLALLHEITDDDRRLVASLHPALSFLTR